MPMACSPLMTASASGAYTASVAPSTASKPFGKPASARSCFARVGSYGYAGGAQYSSKSRGMMLGAGLPNPRYSASLMALRSMARFAASRTRRSAHGDFGSHCSVNTSHSVNVGNVALRVTPAVRLSSRAFGPRMEYATSVSPRLSIARRVDSSGTDLNTSRGIADINSVIGQECKPTERLGAGKRHRAARKPIASRIIDAVNLGQQRDGRQAPAAPGREIGRAHV